MARETHLRSIAKAISWRIGGTAVTFVITLLVTGQIDLATKIGLLDTLVKVGAFYVHERLWHRVGFGKTAQPSTSMVTATSSAVLWSSMMRVSTTS